jgi:hypothetical protein
MRRDEQPESYQAAALARCREVPALTMKQVDQGGGKWRAGIM